jgi:hypothetical protein
MRSKNHRRRARLKRAATKRHKAKNERKKAVRLEQAQTREGGLRR